MMRKIKLFTAALVLSVAAQAGAQLYTQDFETNPGYTPSNDHAVGAAGSTAAYHAFGEWGGTADIGITQTNGALQISSNTSGSSARNRGFTVTIDTSTWVAGIHTVSFDVTNFVDGTGTAGMAVHEGSGLDTLYAQWDVGGNSAGDSWPREQGTAPSAVIGDTGSRGTGITANGTYSFDVALTEAGVAGDYMTLAFAQIRTLGTELAPTFDIDNVLVDVFFGPNLPPVADDQSVDVVQNKFVDITLVAIDPEGSNLTYSVGSPTNGVLTGATNNWTYTPDTDYTGPDSFTFTANDGETDSEPATVSISVNLNTQPVADAQGVVVEKNTSLEITLTASDLETATSNLTYSVGTPTNGVLTGATNNWTYTPDTDYFGPDSFTFTVNDGETDSEPATVSIVVFEQPVEGTILYEEDFSTDPGYTNAGTTAIGSDTNGVGTYFTFGEYNGSGDIGETTDAGVLHIDSNTEGAGARSRGLSVFIDTSAAGPGTYTVSFNVANWVDGTGTAGFKVFEGSGLDTGYLDIDNVDNATNGAVPKKTGGTATWVALGETGAGGTGISSNGFVSFEVELTEAGQTGDYLALALTQVRTLGTELAPTFDVDNVWVGVGAPPPVADAQSVDVVQNSFVDITLTGSDLEGSNLTYSVEDTPTNGVLTGTAPDLTYTPTTDYLGPDSFTFTVYNGGTTSAPSTVSISVNMQQPPVADAQSVKAEKNSFVDITLTGSDPEGSPLTYDVGTPTHGVLTGTAPDLTYTPNTDYEGADSFTFTVNDGEANSEPATVSIEVVVPPPAGVMVQWGSAEGETDIIAVTTINNANNMQTTWDGDLLTGGYAGYYPNAGITRSPNIYGAGSIANEESEIVDDASGDYIRNTSNVSGYENNIQFMLVWQDFLTADRAVTDFSIMVRGVANKLNTGSVQWLVEQDSQWYISANTYAFDSSGYATHSANISTLSWNLFTPFSGGTAVIGAAATPTLDNITAVGYYADVSCPEGQTFAGAEAMYFQCREEVQIVDSYDSWALSYGLTGADTNGNADVENGGLGDGLENLMEYALGGNPTNDDAAAVSPSTYMADDAGTDWFYHVYNQNQDPSLTFTVGATPDLVFTAVDTNDVELVGETAESGGFKTVTSRTEASTDAKFIKLDVSQ
ncbi:beta strand repeat-containing protein [Pontiella sulfatireligans]|uniref:Cadherin domain-containing protein n=1 Tax=Pontiella sulfatireligans TaxID=2750658 RepID=A0A6C2UG31_9BACT|nr:Ig-like domain-containing protein [Pontiella sulfatireligans]VGO18381.1 hypothetical protein SCARR_00433 [Pontiella sulfatireligans]